MVGQLERDFLMIRQKEREIVLMIRQFEKNFIGKKYRKRDRIVRNLKMRTKVRSK